MEARLDMQPHSKQPHPEMSPEQKSLSLQKEILTYLLEHADAKDTVQGVVQWWFSDRSQGAPVADVDAALLELARKGFVTVSGREQANRIYGLDKQRVEEIRRFLES